MKKLIIQILSVLWLVNTVIFISSFGGLLTVKLASYAIKHLEHTDWQVFVIYIIGFVLSTFITFRVAAHEANE